MDSANNVNDTERKPLKRFQDKALAARLATEEAARAEAELTEQIRRLTEERARALEEKARLAAEEEAARLAEEEEAARLAAEEEAARLAAEEEAARLAAEEEAARLAAEEAARRLAAEEAARRLAEEEAARRLAEEAARWVAEEADRLAAEEAASALKKKARLEKAALEENVRLGGKEKGKARAAAESKPRTKVMRQQPHPAHPSNPNPQAIVATSSVKAPRMHKSDSKGVEANDESGHWSEDLSDDVIMLDAGTAVSTSVGFHNKAESHSSTRKRARNT
jgi:hypothetical protein